MTKLFYAAALVFTSLLDVAQGAEVKSVDQIACTKDAVRNNVNAALFKSDPFKSLSLAQRCLQEALKGSDSAKEAVYWVLEKTDKKNRNDIFRVIAPEALEHGEFEWVLDDLGSVIVTGDDNVSFSLENVKQFADAGNYVVLSHLKRLSKSFFEDDKGLKNLLDDTRYKKVNLASDQLIRDREAAAKIPEAKAEVRKRELEALKQFREAKVQDNGGAAVGHGVTKAAEINPADKIAFKTNADLFGTDPVVLQNALNGDTSAKAAVFEVLTKTDKPSRLKLFRTIALKALEHGEYDWVHDDLGPITVQSGDPPTFSSDNVKEYASDENFVVLTYFRELGGSFFENYAEVKEIFNDPWYQTVNKAAMALEDLHKSSKESGLGIDRRWEKERLRDFREKKAYRG